MKFAQKTKKKAQLRHEDKKTREIYKGCPYQRLWKMVLGQAVIDAFSTSQKKRARKTRMDALHWLIIPSEEYNMVCAFSSTDPDFFRESVLKTLNNPNQNELVLKAYAMVASGMYNPAKSAKGRLVNRFRDCWMRKNNMR